MANEYISKQYAVNAINDALKRVFTEHVGEGIINPLKPADVVPVKHGRWIKYTGMGKEQWMCSECSAEEKNPKVANYCYHCGAKMDVQREE